MLLTPGVIYVLAEGWLDSGGGEKDILLAIPYFLWAVIFFIVAIVLIIKRWTGRKWLWYAVSISVAAMLVSGIFVYFLGWLGI